MSVNWGPIVLVSVLVTLFIVGVVDAKERDSSFIKVQEVCSDRVVCYENKKVGGMWCTQSEEIVSRYCGDEEGETGITTQ